MEITFHIPEDLARSLGREGGDLPRRTLEALAMASYQSGFRTRMQVHDFPKEHHVYLNYGPEDLEEDMQTLRLCGEPKEA